MPHSDIYQNPDIFFRTQYAVFGGLLVGPLVLLILFTAFVPPDPAVLDAGLGSVVTYLALFAGALAVLAGFLIYRGRIRNAGAEQLDEKLGVYATANLIRWASLEAAMLFSAVAYGISGLAVNLVLFGVLFVIYLFTYPHRDRFADQFHLTLDEQDRVLRGKSGRLGH